MHTREPGYQFGVIDFSQINILKQLQLFLKSETNYQADAKNIADLQLGHCLGFSSLFLYCCWLQTQPIRFNEHGKQTKRDDLHWFCNMMTAIATINHSRHNIDIMPPALKAEIHRFAHHIIHLQHAQELYEHMHATLAFSVQDNKNRQPKPEFSITGVFNAFDLSMPRAYKMQNQSQQTGNIIELLAQQHRLVIIGTPDHAMGLFYDGKTYKFYDPNSRYVYKCYQPNEIMRLAEDIIYCANRSSDEHNALLVFDIYRMDEKPGIYPEHDDILIHTNCVKPFFRAHYTEPFSSPIFQATKYNCISSLKYYLHNSHILNIDHESLATYKLHSLVMAIQSNKPELVQILLAHGADMEKMVFGKNALHIACYFSNSDIIRILIENGADINAKQEDDENPQTPLCIAARANDKNTVVLLLEFGANPSLTNGSGETPISLTTDPTIKKLIQDEIDKEYSAKSKKHRVKTVIEATTKETLFTKPFKLKKPVPNTAKTNDHSLEERISHTPR